MRIVLTACLTVFSLGLASAVGDDGNFTYPACDSQIYCYGPLLETIQMAHLYTDSKTFVDQKQKYHPNETLARFNEFMAQYNNTPTREEVAQFVNETFDSVGLEFEDWFPEDWTDHPSFLDHIMDETLKQFGSDINAIWKTLGRKLRKEIVDELDLYSIIWVPNPVIVPGGRFREYYYWDSYWIIQGLLLSDMHQTAKGMLENFMYLVETLKHIPNGGRIYYLARSQVPLLIPMVKLYVDHTNDTKFLEDHIQTMEKEFEYWLKNHTIWLPYNDNEFVMAVYGDQSYGPRPESYREDKEEANFFKSEKEKQWYYAEKKAGAESGWDFSSRWFINNGTNRGNLTDIKTRYIVPVELNSVLQWNARLLSEFNEDLGNLEKAAHFATIAEVFQDAITTVLWHEEVGVWLDYDILDKKRRDYFYPTNIAPLWTGSYNKADEPKIVPLVLQYLKSKNVIDPGGVPTTLEHTGEQWDYPNSWPPLVHMMIVGLNNTDNLDAKNLALKISEIWIRANYIGYNQTEAMFEKYDAIVPGQYGGGGEYEGQVGFGWTNGVMIDLLYKYGGELRFSSQSELISTNEIE